MKYFSKFLDRFKRETMAGRLTESPALEELLDTQAQRLRAADPDTMRQWQYLNVVLRRSLALEAGKKMPRPFRILNPAISFGTVAATALVIVGVVWLNRSQVVTYETGRGQQSSIILSDSSEVTLNHTSTLVVESRPFVAERHVSLKGEALFHVRKNGHPFIVSTDLGVIQVLGTQFDVRAREDQLVVGVVSGSVRVSARQSGRDSSVALSAGQIVACSKGHYPGAPGILPFADFPGWTQGKFLFYRTPLSSACKEIESQFDVRIIVENPQAAEESITGVVDGRNPEAAIAALSNLTGTKVRHERNAFTLY